MSLKRFGRAFTRVNGQLLESESGAECDPGGVTRSPRTSDTGTVGFSEEVRRRELERADR
jgi:hypothetical protein